MPRRRRKPKRPGGGSIRRRRSTGGFRWGESQSHVEAELELEEPTEMGDDTSVLEDEGVTGAIVTLVEHREPMAASVDGGHDVETCGDIPESRKHAASQETAFE